jgi:hypothetical protein
MFRNRYERRGGELTDLRATRERDLGRALSADHARLLRALEEADRRPVSIAELERAGIAHPGTLIYELEVAGESIEHVHAAGPSGHRQLVGFRLLRQAGDGAPRPLAPPRMALLGALLARLRG